MARKIEYKPGDKVGTKGCTFIEELPATRDKQGRSIRMGSFTCCSCGTPFSASVKMVRLNKRAYCEECTCKPKEFKYGDVLATDPKIIYLESAGSNKFNKRLAKVKNCETDEEFVAILSAVISGHVQYGPESCKAKRAEHSALARRRYFVGDIIKNPWDEKFLYVEKIDYPYCCFKNLQSNLYFETSIYNVLYGISDGNPQSRGETVISQVLNDLDISYQTQKTFPDLKGERGVSLRYDFWIPSYHCLLEYDGGQHFFAVPKWGGDEYLKDIQQRDSIKNQYAKQHGYNLIRIPYTDFKKIDNDYIIQKLQLIKQKGE